MIILLSGNSCTGKTLMSQKLLEKYKIPYLSMDHLKMGLYRGDINCGFTPLDNSEVIGDKLWPIIKGIIMTVIENIQNIIIEGCYLLPRFVIELEKAYPDQIISVFLGFSTKYIKENFTSSITKHRNDIENRNYPEERSVTQYSIEHEEFRGKCMENGVNYFEIDTDYQEEIMKVYEFIENQISKN
jgi:2-phosphoglycerate kinase